MQTAPYYLSRRSRLAGEGVLKTALAGRKHTQMQTRPTERPL